MLSSSSLYGTARTININRYYELRINHNFELSEAFIHPFSDASVKAAATLKRQGGPEKPRKKGQMG